MNFNVIIMLPWDINDMHNEKIMLIPFRKILLRFSPSLNKIYNAKKMIFMPKIFIISVSFRSIRGMSFIY